MADLALQRTDSGKYDFVRVGSDLQRTGSAEPLILRLLIQGTWIADDGERAGPCLSDLSLSTSQTVAQIQRIIDTRLSVLIRMNRIVSATALDIENKGDRAFFRLQYTEPGQQPRIIQVPLTA